MIGKYRNYLKSMRQDIAQISRGVSQISNEVGAHSGSLRVDEATPRIACVRGVEHSVLSPGAFPWMEKAVYDARPVDFAGRQLAYFCGQPSYNTSADLVVGLAEWNGKRYAPADRPSLYPTDEQSGIDIPSFCVHGGSVIGVYFDNYGKDRVTDCRSRNLIVCVSNDGTNFTKRHFKRPLEDYQYPGMGLPWIESVGSDLYLMVRSKLQDRKIVSRARFDPHSGRCEAWQHSDLARTSINVASVTDGDWVYVFHGYTVAGGFYVSVLNAQTFETHADVMVVDNAWNPWGWDMRKVCASPCRSGDDLIVLYTASNGIGRAELALSDLRAVI